MTKDSLKYDVATHYQFGQNWHDYAETLDERHLTQAESALSDLVGADALHDKSFLDIGCGSGVHSLAALRLGARQVLAVDFDPKSVATTKATLAAHWSGDNAEVIQGNILSGITAAKEPFDIVYSWGVLHHTGAMWQAIEQAALCVAENGTLVIAIYKKTPLCGLWRWEKRIYSRLPRVAAAIATYLYAGLFIAGLLASGRNPIKYIKSYKSRRGMRWLIDLNDWLGGYPYESARPDEIEAFLARRGFTLRLARDTRPPPLKGLFGSGCAEYVFEREQVAEPGAS